MKKTYALALTFLFLTAFTSVEGYETNDVIFDAHSEIVADLLNSKAALVGNVPMSMDSTNLKAEITIVLNGIQVVYRCPIVILDGTNVAVKQDLETRKVTTALNCDVLFSDGFE